MSEHQTPSDLLGSPLYAEQPGEPVKLLIVDDGVVDRRLAGAIVERSLGWKVVYAENGRSAMAVLEAEAPRVLLTDPNMPEMYGVELVAPVRRLRPFVRVVLLTPCGT